MTESAQDTRSQIFIVEASAGSGKTYALAKRYVSLLLAPDEIKDNMPFRNILAITFTNKAANEMKSRIMDFLKRIALDKFDSEEQREEFMFLPRFIGAGPSSAKAASFSLMDELIRHYSYFQVRTIDSFMNEMLSGSSFKINLSTGFRILDKVDDYLWYSLDELIDEAASDKKIMAEFNKFLGQYLFIERKASWLPKNNIYGVVKQLYCDSNIYGKPFKRYKSAGKNIYDAKKELADLARKFLQCGVEGINKTTLNSIERFVEKGEREFDIDDVSKIFKSEEIKANKGYGIDPKAQKIWDDIRRAIKDIYELEAFSLFNCYLDIYDKVIANLNELAAKENVIFLEELNSRAARLFSEDSSSVEEMYYMLATRIRHYLFDEFQDTSRLQWKNLYLMIEEALATGGSLYYVGDKKQAIYRFRGGDALLFDSAWQGFYSDKPEIKALSSNYRSDKEIVDFNNKIFSRENLKRFILSVDEKNKAIPVSEHAERIISPYENCAQQCTNRNSRGYINVDRIGAEEDENIEDLTQAKLINRIAELKDRFNLKDIAVICRENSEVKTVTSWLLSAGYPVESEKTLSIRENPLIKEIISLLMFLDSPADNLSFASFILGEIFLKASGLKRREIEKFIIDCKISNEYYYKQFESKYGGIWDKLIDPVFKKAGFAPLYEFVINIFDMFGLPALFPDNYGFFMRFIELVKDHEQDCGNMGLFLEYFDSAPEYELYMRVKDIGAIKVTSIHKAKGLEFGAVVMPFFKMEIKAGGGQGRKPYTVIEEEDCLMLARLRQKQMGFSPKIDRLYINEYLNALSDELNNVYVALTRAKHELHIFIPPKAGKSNNIALNLIPENIKERGKIRVEEAGLKPVSTDQGIIEKILPGKYGDITSLLKDEYIDAAVRRPRISGNVAHLILSHIGNLLNKDAKREVADAVLKAKTEYPYEDLDKKEEELLKLINDKEIRELFYITDGAVFTEKEIIDKNGQKKRIDRLIINKKEAVIVDYKASRDASDGIGAGEDDYVEQVRSYMDIIKAMMPKLKAKGYLIYLDECRMEEVLS